MAQAALAVPLFWAIATDTPDLGVGDPAAADAWTAALICLVFFTGSVLHVKSLDPRGRRPPVGAGLAGVPRLRTGDGTDLTVAAAAVRRRGGARLRRAGGQQAAVIGAVEIVVSVLVVVAAALALG